MDRNDDNTRSCDSSYSFVNGRHMFSFSAKGACDKTIQLGWDASECKSSYVTIVERIHNCHTSQRCTSASALCFLHVCAALYREAEHYERDRRVPSEAHIEGALSEFLNNSHVQHIDTFRIGNARDVLRNTLQAAHVQQLQVNRVSGDRISKLNILAEIACGLATTAALPFHMDGIRSLARAYQIPSRPSGRLVVFTYCNKQHPGLDILIESAQAKGISLHITGWGDETPSPSKKLSASLSFIESLNNDDIVMFVDGYDTVILEDASTIISKFRRKKSSVVFGGENACFPMLYTSFNLQQDFCNDYYPKASRLRFVNTGQYIGYASSLRGLLSDYRKLVGLDMIKQFPGTDQHAIGLMVMSRAWDIVIDHEGDVFQVAMAYPHDHIIENTSVIHFNGDATTKERGIRWGRRYLKRTCRPGVDADAAA